MSAIQPNLTAHKFHRWERLLGVDPGTTTGLAWFDANSGVLDTETMPVNSALDRIDEVHDRNPLTHIAIERFATSGKLSTYGLETIDLVGQIKGWAYAKGVTVYLFNPQSRRAWMPPFTEREKTPHQQDAKAHLLHLMEELKLRQIGAIS